MRWGLALVVLVACHASKTKTFVSDSAPAAPPPTNAPPAFAKLASATLVEVRETSDTAPADLVIKLSRVGDHFDWDGKGAPFANSLGERLPDPIDPKKCSCDVLDYCSACDDVPAASIQRKSGRLSASVVEAFLNAIAQHGWSGADAGVWSYGDRVHVVVNVPGEPPLHLGYFDPARQWTVDDKPVDDGPGLHTAYGALRSALDIPGWLTSMAPPVAPLPADFADLPKAVSVEIHDQWNGLGKTHDEVVRFERTKADFDWRAKIASYAGSLGDSMPDPFSPPEKYSTPCTCDVDSTCSCEHMSSLLRKKGSTSPKLLEAFLAEIARHTIDPSPPKSGAHWTDDYPKGHVIVRVTSSSTPIHLSFLDQSRQWRANGRVLSADPATPKTGLDIQHPVINASYRALLDGMGQGKWIDEVHALKPVRPLHRTR